MDGITEGAACTALLAKEYIDNDAPLFFANSDQWVDWNPVGFMYEMQETEADGGIVTFKSTHPKWSFAKIDGRVTEVAEKNPISENATVGYYYWKHGSEFVKYAEQMIEKDIRVNNEFYICPVFNESDCRWKRDPFPQCKINVGTRYTRRLRIFPQGEIMKKSKCEVRLIGRTQPIEGNTGTTTANELVAYTARVSNPTNQNNNKTASKLVRYLIKHQHWSPFEMVHLTLEIKTTRDISRQILRHRSFCVSRVQSTLRRK